MFEKLSEVKKEILTFKLISSIIINFLRIRELYGKIKDKKLIETAVTIKDFSGVIYDILTLNIISLMYKTIPIYNTVRKIYKNIRKRYKKE